MKQKNGGFAQVRQMVVYFVTALRHRQIRLYAAQAAYFVLFSALPLLMLSFAVVGHFVPDAGVRVAERLYRYYPDAATFADSAWFAHFFRAGLATVSASALAMVWSASHGMRAICEGLSRIYRSHFTEKHFVWRYVYSFFYTLLLLVVVTVTILLMVLGDFAAQFLGKLFPRLLGLLQALVDLRFLIVLAILVLFFWLLYWLIGRRQMPFIRHLPGALFGGCGWILYSCLFSLYVRHFSGWQSIYGGLSVLLVLMLWLYGCMYILMFGALLNVYLQKRPFMIK